MTECANTKAKRALQALFRGELDAEDFTWLRTHAATCPSCRETYDKLSRVESSLEKRALPEGRQALLEQALFARLAESRAPAPVRAPRPSERPSFFRPWMGFAMGLATVAALTLLVVIPEEGDNPRRSEEWGVRSGEGSAWGVRAFCVGADGRVRAEARPGGTLPCEEGGSVQFSYTAPEAARLTIETTSASGEPLRFFPSEGPPAEVAPGVDVVLPLSTPVQGGWLSGPLDVRARFTDARGQVLGETRLTLTPR
ncbi:zf-HC2 domain-containing protein [Pyxidicoccus parkwayensis]|uniref:Zf-HC2 domain-containing protein n=1 Tax=Pyxidicoccus parkwayensis TaxID=2813578 RepID=A0ABX7NS58_9BACT|nr:zf-HC2 domain-containing protein [Pyxidicoccus parkwaysis]QSQ21719.1 zf-HC2 domain-containing protein [Pyxidicoccus parkwaysis]